MTSAGNTKTGLTTTHEGDIPAPEWIVFGDANKSRVIFLYHHEDDDKPDRFYQMQKKMTVFGFGRDREGKHIVEVPQSFSIGFIESTEYATIAETLKQLTMNN
jgi:hypothetical protein